VLRGWCENNTISTAAIMQYQLNYKHGNAKGVRNCFGPFGVMLGFTWRDGENCEGPHITRYLCQDLNLKHSDCQLNFLQSQPVWV
jgi:hypothetical protein